MTKLIRDKIPEILKSKRIAYSIRKASEEEYRNKLKEGDKLYIEDAKGKTITFIVRESRTYDPGYADEVFNPNDSAHLNLVTCDGTWNGTKKSYTKRLVVFADMAN